ncbi:MAG: response regulator transcription factor [Phycisphaerales bacterium]|nr:response regulator transcription factor [Phycisphaerales bacterium]MCB9855424.1 response regulator transcription factor [Phycisphaerales bacterium]
MFDFEPLPPESDPHETPVSASEVCTRRLDKCSILVAEGDPSQRKLIERFLAAEGARVTATSGSAEAVATLFGVDARDEDTDIVLLNANLPDIRDVDAIGRLRDGGFTRTIIAMAWKRDSENRAALINAGYDDVLLKPVSRDELITIVEVHFKRRSAARLKD